PDQRHSRRDVDYRARKGHARGTGSPRGSHGCAWPLLVPLAAPTVARCRRIRRVGNGCDRKYNMTMSGQHDPAVLEKRTVALLQQADEAQRTIDELRSRDALKTQFLSNVSHDLRTPLAAIITHAEILRDGMLGDLNSKQKDSVTGIVNGGKQLLDMVDEILTYVRSASDQISLIRTEFSITEVVDQVRMLNQ